VYRDLNSVKAIRTVELRSAFVGHSFSEDDQWLIVDFKSLLTKLGLICDSGERPATKSVSEKVKERVRASDIFVGIFTRRERIEGREEWTTSPWVIEEKAMAIELGKPLLLFIEEGVKEIGGLQGDYEYVSFSRDKLHKAFLKVVDYVQSLGISVRKSSAEDLYQVCRSAQEAGRFGEALETLEKLVLMTPRNARYHFEFGRALLQAGEYARAIEVLQNAVTLDPTTGVAHHQLAHAYDRSGRTEDALYSFQRALEIDPDVSSNYRCYGECLYRKSLSLRTNAEKEQTLKKVLRLLESCAKIGGDEERKRVAGYILMIPEQLAEIAEIEKTGRDVA
jgi:hypothetical protein